MRAERRRVNMQNLNDDMICFAGAITFCAQVKTQTPRSSNHKDSIDTDTHCATHTRHLSVPARRCFRVGRHGYSVPEITSSPSVFFFVSTSMGGFLASSAETVHRVFTSSY